MARLLAYLSASSGNTFPAIDMLLELRRRGHEVHVRCRASDVDGYGALGLRAAAIDPLVEQVEFDDWRGRSQVDSFMRMVRCYRECAKLEIPDLRQASSEVRPGRPDRGRQLLRRDVRGRGVGIALGCLLPVPAAVPLR